MVFYAYCKLNANANNGRYLLSAPSVDVIDEWWRTVQPLNLGFERHSPEWYTYTSTAIETTLANANQANKFMNSMMVTLLPDLNGRSMNIIPKQQVTNYISGNTYYIRSKNNPKMYWAVSEEGKESGVNVWVSATSRTRFRIRAKENALNGKVLINSDEVYVTFANNPKVFVGACADGSIMGEKHPHTFKFKDLKSGHFTTQNEALVEAEDGEEWEILS